MAAIIALLAGIIWSAGNETGVSTLVFDGNETFSIESVLGDTLITAYGGTWAVEGDSLVLNPDPSSLRFNGLTVDEVAEEFALLMNEAANATDEELAELIAGVRAGLLEGFGSRVALAFTVENETLTTTDADGEVTVWQVAGRLDTAVLPRAWGAVKAAGR